MGAILDLAGRPWVRTLALIASILALASLLWQSDEPREPTAAADLRGATEPDGFVVNGRYLAFNETGQLTSHIESPRIEQFESTRLATMMAPEATLYDESSGVPWTLRADNGRFTEGTDIVELEGNVVLTRPLGGQPQPYGIHRRARGDDRPLQRHPRHGHESLDRRTHPGTGITGRRTL